MTTTTPSGPDAAPTASAPSGESTFADTVHSFASEVYAAMRYFDGALDKPASEMRRHGVEVAARAMMNLCRAAQPERAPAIGQQADSEQAEFEAWARSDGYALVRADGSNFRIPKDSYLFNATATAWHIWQARAAIAQHVEVKGEPPSTVQFKDECDLIKFLDGLYECNESGAAYNLKWDAAQRAIAGIRTTSANSLIEAGALRQYRHNDGSGGFVHGYDKAITDRVFASLGAHLSATNSEVPAPQAAPLAVEEVARAFADAGLTVQWVGNPAKPLTVGSVDLQDIAKVFDYLRGAA